MVLTNGVLEMKAKGVIIHVKKSRGNVISQEQKTNISAPASKDKFENVPA